MLLQSFAMAFVASVALAQNTDSSSTSSSTSTSTSSSSRTTTSRSTTSSSSTTRTTRTSDTSSTTITIAPASTDGVLNLYALGGFPGRYSGSVIAADSVSTTWAVTCSISRIYVGENIFEGCPNNVFTVTQSSRNWQYRNTYTSILTVTPFISFEPDVVGPVTTITYTNTITQAASVTTLPGGVSVMSMYVSLEGNRNGYYNVGAFDLANLPFAAVTMTAGAEKIASASTVSRTATDTLSVPTAGAARSSGNAASGRRGSSGGPFGAGLVVASCLMAVVGGLAVLL